MRQVLVVWAIATGSVALAFRPAHAGGLVFWGALFLPYSALAAWSLWSMKKRGVLRERLLPRGGDLALGAVIGALLLLASWFGRSKLTPAGSVEQAWLLRAYLQVGDPETLQNSLLFTLLLLLLPLFEEIVWRGHVQHLLEERFGTRRGWPACALLYGAAHLPTVLLLADPVAGPNPLVFLAALGAGLVWSFAAHQLGRLGPVIVSHMVFTYFTAVQFRVPGL